MSISQNFPAISPTLNLNFARSKKLDPRITFTRTSSATRTNAQGLIEVVSADTPRFDHSYNSSSGSVNSLGLLIEESRTNLVLRSEEFDNAYWTKNGTTVTPDASQSPAGGTTADLVAVASSGGSKSVYCNIASLTVANNYTLSFYAKAGASSTVAAGLLSTTFLGLYNFTLTGAGSVSADIAGVSAAITLVGNGWYRCQLTVTTTSVGVTLLIYPNSTSNSIGDSIFLWGAQLETGSFPTSYIPTVASTVTRSADSASMTGTNFSSWYNSSEWTLVTRTSVPSSNLIASPAAVQYSSIDDGTTNNWYTIRYVTNTSSPYIDGYAKASGAPTFDFTGSSTYTFPNPVKSALAVKLNDAAFCYNGNTVETDSSVTLSTSVNRLVIGGVPKAGTISQLLYYPRRLTNTQLQNLTK